MSARIATALFGQDFALGVNAGTAATSHVLSRANGTSLEPRVARMLGRLALLDPSFGFARGLVQALSVSGFPLIMVGGPGTTTNASTTTRAGFPLRACLPTAQVDRHNTILCACGPNAPLEMTVSWNVAQALRGTIGTDDPDPALLPEILEALAAGDLYGEPNFALGGGEVTQGTANTAQTITMRYKAPRAMRLERLVIDLFKDNQGAVVPGEFLLTNLSIRGLPLLATSSAIDCLTLSPMCTDEDGLQVGVNIDADDEIGLDIAVLAFGANVSGVIQHGFFTS